MNCNSVVDNEKRILEKLSGDGDFGKMKPKGGTLERVSCTNAALMAKDFSYGLSIPYTANWNVNGKLRKIEVPVLASHCPFCGKAADKEEAQ